MAADLVSRGLNVGEINQLTYDNQPYRKVELMRTLLNTLDRSEDHKLVWWTCGNPPRSSSVSSMMTPRG